MHHYQGNNQQGIPPESYNPGHRSVSKPRNPAYYPPPESSNYMKQAQNAHLYPSQMPQNAQIVPVKPPSKPSPYPDNLNALCNLVKTEYALLYVDYDSPEVQTEINAAKNGFYGYPGARSNKRNKAKAEKDQSQIETLFYECKQN